MPATARQFECTRLITATQVIATIKRIPGLIAPGLTALGHAEGVTP